MSVKIILIPLLFSLIIFLTILYISADILSFILTGTVLFSIIFLQPPNLLNILSVLTLGIPCKLCND